MWITPTTTERYRLDKALRVMKTVMARRLKEIGPNEEALIKELERTTNE